MIKALGIFLAIMMFIIMTVAIIVTICSYIERYRFYKAYKNQNKRDYNDR